MQRSALVVRGGWEGHDPVPTTDLFIARLLEAGFDVTIEDGVEVRADEDVMGRTDLVLQLWTMGEILADELTGIRRAVEARTGLAGWHGGATGATWCLSDSHAVPSDQRRLALESLESWVVRRMLLRLTSKDVNKFMVSVLRSLADAEPTMAGAGVVSLLSDQTADSRYWPGDADVLTTLPDTKLYWNIRQNRLCLVLESIEAYERAKDPRFGSVSLPAGLSLEHVMPHARHWDTVPPLSPEAAARRDRIVDTLGNLTLVTQSLNSPLSNRPWADEDAEGLRDGGHSGWGKRALLDQFNLLVLNKQVLKSAGEWGDTATRKRSLRLAQAVCEIWPGPTVNV